MNSNDKIDIDQPLWDQSTYIGRWKHYAFITDCRTVIVPREKLLTAKQLCEDYRNDTVPPGTAMKDIIYAKKLKDSAFHPDNGQLMHVLGRMSFQLPSSVTITTMMLTFYKSATAIVLCQIINQTHNALLNYTNRNAMTDNDFADKNSVKTAFLCAVSASSAVVVGCEKILHQRGPITSRCVPFLVVATGDVTNLPLMRQREIMMDTPLFIEDAIEPIINSKVAAVKAISECVLTRIALAVPCLLFIPMITQAIKPYCFYQRGQWMIYPIEITFAYYLLGIPSSLALFPRYRLMSPELLKIHKPEYMEFREKVKQDVDKVYYYK
ncbi:Sideroflexin-1 [Dufourea novaeangliae]|uniref:Sideroflexin-1 n=1 Tax=Dufourea novaeangliae TaxID=178035 RepID=A0A154PMY0_DUFNO|nr:Sideroflexin-1 [Dufourea novaeangliae]